MNGFPATSSSALISRTTAMIAQITLATLLNGSGTPTYEINQFTNHHTTPAMITQITACTST